MQVIAYLLTWTTYGSWLQGDRRGWVKDGTIYPKDIELEETNRKHMAADVVVLSRKQRMITSQAIVKEAVDLKQDVLAFAVCPQHIHLVVRNISMSIGRVVSHYKNAIRLKLQAEDFKGKLWTAGFDKRYCMNDREIAARIAYIHTHRNKNTEVKIVSPPIYSGGFSVDLSL